MTSVMRRCLALACAGALSASALAGCGQKGPLYLPQEEAEKKKPKTSLNALPPGPAARLGSRPVA